MRKDEQIEHGSEYWCCHRLERDFPEAQYFFFEERLEADQARCSGAASKDDSP